MKALCSMAALGLALLMTSCSLTQQVASDAAEKPEAKPLTQRGGNIFNTRGRRTEQPEEQKKNEEEKAKPAEEAAATAVARTEPAPAPAPTEAQQNAARQLLAETTASPAAPTAAPAADALPGVTDGDYDPPAPWNDYAAPLPSGGLRRGSIAPSEEAASSSDAPPPGANSVELHGLRSPKLPKGLPMNIDGKLNTKN